MEEALSKRTRDTKNNTTTGWWLGTSFKTNMFYILGIIIPTDCHIFQRGRSTTNQQHNNQEVFCGFESQTRKNFIHIMIRLYPMIGQ